MLPTGFEGWPRVQSRLAKAGAMGGGVLCTVEEEKNKLLSFASNLDYKKFNVLNYEFLNQPGPPPQILAIKKRNKEA